jgi:hypothetical protein
VDNSGGVGEYASMAVDTSGKVHISYYDNTSNTLKYSAGTVCEAKSIKISPNKLEITRNQSKVATVTVEGNGGCVSEGVEVMATINKSGKKRISILPESAVTDDEGKSTFTITALNKTGEAKVKFKAGELKKTLTVSVGM